MPHSTSQAYYSPRLYSTRGTFISQSSILVVGPEPCSSINSTTTQALYPPSTFPLKKMIVKRSRDATIFSSEFRRTT